MIENPCYGCWAKGSPARGYANAGKVYLCPAAMDDNQQAGTVLLEEIQHHYDRCEGSFKNDCESKACIEVRGKTFAGECDDPSSQIVREGAGRSV